MKLKYIESLDGVRGYAALMVVVFHFFFSGGADYSHYIKTLQKITEFGQHGVSLFFVLSGFLITRILIKSRNDKDYFKKFYIRRILRIFPLYYLYLLFNYYLIPLFLNSECTSFKLQLPYYLYLQNFNEILGFQQNGPGHFWSLAVEEHFYLLWPALLFFVTPKNLYKIIVISLILIFILRYFMIDNGYSINYFTFTRIDQIMVGSILALLEIRNILYTKKTAYTFLIMILSILPLGVLLYQFQSSFQYINELLKHTILAFFFFAVIGIIIINPTSKIIRFLLLNKIIQYLGKISYGIYVWHMMVIYMLQKLLFFKNILLDIFLVILLTIFISHLSYYYFEVKFLKLKDKLTKPTIIK